MLPTGGANAYTAAGSTYKCGKKFPEAGKSLPAGSRIAISDSPFLAQFGPKMANVFAKGRIQYWLTQRGSSYTMGLRAWAGTT